MGKLTIMPMILRIASIALALLVAACSPPEQGPQAVDFTSDNFREALEPLGQSIGDSQILLLGENGHGVGEFSEAKVELIKWLHDEHGFEAVVFESGLFECGYAWQRIDTLSTRKALLDCLRYPFQHAELLPLFAYMQEQKGTAYPLELAGMDPQAQGFDSAPRPGVSQEVLTALDPILAEQVARADSALYLAASAGGKGEALYGYAFAHQDSLKELYQSAALQTEGWQHWVFRLSEGWIDRLAVRGKAEAEGTDRPGTYYEVRDEWMARGVAAYADSIQGARKVIVWLHNEHGAYGSFKSGGHEIRSVGSFLKEWYGDRVYSVGFYMGSGSIADNGRNIREVAALDSTGVEAFLAHPDAPASYLVLRGNKDLQVQTWAEAERPYLRMGLWPVSIVPADEFDALFYIDSVSPPNYDLR